MEERGDWGAAVHRVTKSQTGLNDWTTYQLYLNKNFTTFFPNLSLKNMSIIKHYRCDIIYVVFNKKCKWIYIYKPETDSLNDLENIMNNNFQESMSQAGGDSSGYWV